MVQHSYVPGPNIAKGAEVDEDICTLRQSVARVRHTQAAMCAEGPAQAQQQQDPLQAHHRPAGTGSAHHSSCPANHSGSPVLSTGFGAPWVSPENDRVPARTAVLHVCRMHRCTVSRSDQQPHHTVLQAYHRTVSESVDTGCNHRQSRQ
jgi:hypothetical protein